MAIDYHHIVRQIEDLEFERIVGMVPQEYANIYPRIQKVMDDTAVRAPALADDCNEIRELARAAGFVAGRPIDRNTAAARAKLETKLGLLLERAKKKAARPK